MRLGVVLTGVGACAAASAGALTWMLDAGIVPYAVCGMQAAAWPAALYLVGYDADRLRGAMVQAAHMGKRLLTGDATFSALLRMRKKAFCQGGRLEKLLSAQTGERPLGLCDRQGVFLCRAGRSGHTVAFCTQSITPEGALVTLQASAGFAARAVLARPPFLAAKEWMGSPLLPMDDVPTACRLLQTMGAQRVLVIAPYSAIHHEPDALEQTSGFFVPCVRELGENVGVLRVPLPDSFGALCLDRLLVGANAGRETAAKEMEAALGRLGLPLCRVLPFRRKLTAP